MSSAEFDHFADVYEKQHSSSIRLSGEDAGYFSEYKARDANLIAKQRGIVPDRILDFGSGIGNAVKPLRDNFPDAELTCLDVSEESLSMSRSRHRDLAVRYCHYDGKEVPAELGLFDLIFTACVFHHIPPSEHVALLEQLKRHLKPNGIFVLFEHNPWNPLTLNAVNNCPFDENAILISAPLMQKKVRTAGFSNSQVKYRIFFPGLLSTLRPLERFLTKLPIGAQYCLIAN